MQSERCARRCDVLIMGAGVAGLACAVGLVDAGLRVIVIEKDAAPCGRARSFPDPVTGDRVDIGPHVLVSEYPNLLALLAKLGTRERIVWHEDELITLLSRTGAQSMRSSALPAPLHLLPSMLKVRDVSLRDKVSNMRAMWLALRLRERDLLKLDRVPAKELLNRLGVTPRFTDWFWRSAALSLLNVPLEECSSAALMRLFAQLITHDRYCFGFPGCALDELFWPAARGVLGQSDTELLFGRAVTGLLQDQGTCKGVVLEDGAVIEANHCVSCLPPAALLRVLPAPWKHNGVFRPIGTFRACPYISVFHWLDRKVTRQRFWTQVWSKTHLNCDFYDLSNIRRGWGERPSVIASNIVHSASVENESDDAISDRTLQETARFAPEAARARLLHRRIHRIPMAIPCPHPGTESIRPSTHTPYAGLLLAGDWVNTALPACMESAARAGFLAAEHIRSRHGRPRALAKLPSPPQGLVGLIHRIGRTPPA